MSINRRKILGLISTAGFAVACGRRPTADRWPFQMGDLIRCGWFSYNVLEVEYKSQLGEGAVAKRPQNGYLLIRLQATSAAGATVSIPFLRIESEGGETIPEVDNASELSNWLGVLRRVEPGATETGWVAFDAVPGAYGLRLSDGVLDDEHTASVRIPLQIDSKVK